MKRSNYMMVTMLISGVLFASGFALSSEDTPGQEQNLLTATLSLEEAIGKAKAKFPGQVLETELESEEGQAVYEIEIASATGVVTEVKVDAQSGVVLSSDIEDHDDTEQEKSEKKDTN